jgi:hypothetical protein
MFQNNSVSLRKFIDKDAKMSAGTRDDNNIGAKSCFVIPDKRDACRNELNYQEMWKFYMNEL